MKEEHKTNNMTADCLSVIPALPRETGTQNKVRVPSSNLNRGVRRACINLDPSRRSNKRREQQIVINVLIPEHFPELSIRLSELLDDIGAGKCTVMERRVAYLRRECMYTITEQLQGKNLVCFHFGSRSEGTTIPGLNSDIDLLKSHYNENIMTDWRDWKAGICNFLMLHDDITPPQQYLLQVIRHDTPEPSTSLCGDVRFVRKDSGQVLLSSDQYKKGAKCILQHEREITTHGPSVRYTNGPSVSNIPNWDCVTAFHVCQPLAEIQHWIDRCRGRRWPPAQLLEAARTVITIAKNGDCLRTL
ncbi:hypothetical protein DPMN_138477 [Dreissena polymorpha]|uniref:Uncharacterized protein n=1 Tax=Dreissena polymorpha TaxID=45954 RepID=A0A9D4G4A9_DREPO|nr:hypothetical protein DPMN_138477 [Dreissena polymorpha]